MAGAYILLLAARRNSDQLLFVGINSILNGKEEQLMDDLSKKRGAWGSRIGFLITTWFAAIGIGNMWRFPFRCATNGGGAFLLPYLFFILTVSVPAVIMEASTGKYAHKDAVGTTSKVGGLRGSGVLTLLINLFGSYYMVVVSQSLYWLWKSIKNDFAKEASETLWSGFMDNKGLCFAVFALTVVLAVIPPVFGIKEGVERVGKYIGGFAIIIIVVGAIRAITLPGAMDGVAFFLTPNWSQMFTAQTLTSALSQAYFTFGAGWGWFMILSSYLNKTADVGMGHLTSGFADTFFALMSGFAIIPTLFASGYTTETIGSLGASTAYVAMPKVFVGMKGGYILALLFFAALFFAAYSCAYVMVEVIGSFFIDSLKWSRKKASVAAGACILICGAAPAISPTVLDALDTIFGCYLLPLIVTLQVIGFGYRFGKDRMRIGSVNLYGNGYIGKWLTGLYLFWVPVINIFLMLWYAITLSGDGIPWYYGWKVFAVVIVIALAVVLGFNYVDRKNNVPYDGMPVKTDS